MDRVMMMMRGTKLICEKHSENGYHVIKKKVPLTTSSPCLCFLGIFSCAPPVASAEDFIFCLYSQTAQAIDQ